MWRSIAIVLLLLAAGSQAKDQAKGKEAKVNPAQVAMSGLWHLDRKATTRDLTHDPTAKLVITQLKQGAMRFDYYDGEDQNFATDTLTPDGRERPSRKTRLERGLSRVRWDKQKLVIHTRSFLDPDGYQQYETTDTWELSPDQQTLTDQSSDGKVMVFRREK